MLILKQDDKKTKQECLHYLTHPGAVLLLPTETVYGLVCNWDDKEAVRKIRQMKGRDAEKPLQMLSGSLVSLEEVGVEITNEIRKVYDTFCPGPITIIAKASRPKTIGFRIPDHGLMQDLLLAFGSNFAATSANLAGFPPAVTVDEALSTLNGSPDLIVDAGPIKGKASTVVDMTGPYFHILREGPITEKQIAKVLI